MRGVVRRTSRKFQAACGRAANDIHRAVVAGRPSKQGENAGKTAAGAGGAAANARAAAFTVGEIRGDCVREVIGEASRTLVQEA